MRDFTESTFPSNAVMVPRTRTFVRPRHRGLARQRGAKAQKGHQLDLHRFSLLDVWFTGGRLLAVNSDWHVFIFPGRGAGKRPGHRKCPGIHGLPLQLRA